MLTNNIAVVIKLEVTPGTRVEPVASDNDIVFFDVAQPSVDVGVEQVGNLANGTFQKGQTKTGKHQITAGDMQFYLNRPAGNTTYAKWGKLAKLSNGTEGIVDTKYAIIWDGKQTCQTASFDVYLMECATATKLKGRGARGNLTFGWNGSNAPFMATFGNLAGAYVGKEDVNVSSIPALTSPDTRAPEKAGDYVITIGGAVYQGHAFNFNSNCEISMEGGNNSTGIVKAKTTNSDMKVTMSVSMLNTADNMLADAIAGTTFATITAVGSGLAGFDINLRDAQLSTTPAIGDVDGTTTWDLEFQLKQLEMVYRTLV